MPITDDSREMRRSITHCALHHLQGGLF